HEMPVPPCVEDVARADHEELPREGPRVQEPVSEEHQAEEDREVDGGEEHRRATLEQADSCTERDAGTRTSKGWLIPASSRGPTTKVAGHIHPFGGRRY